jgi:Tfp pilus assembly protein PilF
MIRFAGRAIADVSEQRARAGRPRRVVACALAVALCTLAGCHSSPPITPPRQNTELARVQNAAAYKLIREGKYTEAEDILRNALAADVLYGPARNNLGLVYYHQGKLYPAAWEFENAIKLMPHQPEPRNNLGLVLEAAGKLAEATESYARARELEPDNPEYIANLARIRVKRGLRDEETRRLLQELVFKDTRLEWIRWAKEQLIHVPAPGEDIILLPTTRPSGG